MRLVLAAATLVLAGLLPVAPAHAASFAPPEPTCVQQVSALADGTVYGAGDCGGGVSLAVRRPGTGWRSLGVAWRDLNVEAVAVDETATFVVMSCTGGEKGCPTAYPLAKDLFIAKVPHGGRPSALTVLGSTESTDDTATVAARGGRWWAAFTSTARDFDVEGSGGVRIYYRKTFGGRGYGEVPVPPPGPGGGRTFAYDPSIALTDSGAVLAFVTQVEDSLFPAALQLAKAPSGGGFRTEPFAPASGAPAAAPDVAVSGGRTFVAWSRAGRPALAFSRNGRMTRTDLPHRGQVSWNGPSVAASGGLVTVSTAESFSYRGGRTTRVYARALDASGTVRSTTELTAAAARRDPHLSSEVTDTTAARGRATAAFHVDERRLTAAQR